MELSIIPGTFAICRLEPSSTIPAWALGGDFVSITRTSEELALVCAQENVPDHVECERDWQCLRVQGKLDFNQSGILASLATPLADAGISIFAVSTFDTDYVLVKQKDFQRAVLTLRQAGHRIQHWHAEE